MDPDLRAAFLRSTYGTHERFRFTSVRGQVGPSWATPGGRWAVVTAWNPAGRKTDAVPNVAAQARLAAASQGWCPLPGWNGDGAWREEALILRGVSLREAARLGRQFGQAAVVWGVGRRAALVWLDDASPGPSLTVERWWATPGGRPV